MEQRWQSKEEIARRGEELYQQIRPQVEDGNAGKILVLDIETGDYIIDTDLLTATRRARARRSNPVLYSVRIGYPSLAKIGGTWRGTGA